VYVSLEGEELVETLDAPSTPALQERLSSEEVSLPEGYHAEINLALTTWMREVASALEKGFALTIDYGHPAKELYSRPRGTFTCFRQHTQTDDPYQHIGKQDMTAQVDFTALMGAGETHGLKPLGLTTQREFFQNLGLAEMMAGLRGMGLEQREADANRMGMLDIVRPGGMGEFKVLAQGKSVGSPELWGFARSAVPWATLQGLPVPLRTDRHLPLLEGRYPHQGYGWERLSR
jgi:SAM-dependent MidA family methyltransferase